VNGDMENRRIYSFNLGVYLSMLGFDYTIHEDEEKPHLFYFVFKENPDVSKAIMDYKAGKVNVNLRSFTNMFYEIRTEIKVLMNPNNLG
jgi:hypothetical protein